MTILGTLGFMLTLNAPITLLVVLITPLSLLVANFIAKRTYAMFRLQSATRGEQTALIDEIIGEQKVVQAFGHGRRDARRVRRSQRASAPDARSRRRSSPR